MARELALILDMDGVIIDSNPVHRQVWAAYNRRFGIETDEAMQQRMYGRRNDDILISRDVALGIPKEECHEKGDNQKEQ